MTNKQRTLIFIAVGTIISIILTLIILILLILVGSLLLKERIANFLPLVLMIAIFLSLFVYQKLTVFVVQKWNLEDKLDPLFKSKKRRKPRD
ncbi:MAG TPA: leader peptide processing enzyme [Treponemataceae bacterium]|nr:leader peptide processing enzyme [Treponemataceae bacterium]HOQ92215.1 leader peptide processing enzyme [Treponemataceae bacterium]HPM05423.1 leader peptide processing enzyme [Treponemataceae bacterium]